MNCLTFRRLAYQDPNCNEPDFLRHEQECEACRQFHTGQRRLEQLIERAVSIDEPKQLASKILLRQSFANDAAKPPVWSSFAVRLFAACAVVLLLVSTAIVLPMFPRATGLDKTIVALINEAPFALAPTERVSARKIASALEPLGIALDDDVGSVTFASRCFVRDKLAGHIVIKGEAGPITILIIPNQRLLARGEIRSGHWNGVIVPASNGAIAIVATPGESLEKLEQRIVQAVRWNAIEPSTPYDA